jgi:acyl dehydratase
MAIDRKHLGRRYGPYRYVVGSEKIRDFALTVSGGIPGRVFPSSPTEPPHPFFVDEEAAKASPYGSLVAPPMFAVNFAMQPFAVACADPALEIDLVRLVHGEQEFEFSGVIRPGDVIETLGEISELRSRGPLDFLTVKTTSKNQRGEVVVEALWTAIIRA